VIFLAVDGGNFKTDVALLDSDGESLALVRGPRSSPHHIGVDGCVDLLGKLLAEAGLDGGADGGTVLLAGADLPEELAELHEAIEARGWAPGIQVANDTLAVLRAGTDSGWGVAVVCGGGINCVGRAPDGSEVRFPALGRITGDWGGGSDIGLAALSAAARSADGRGPKTALERAVPLHYGLATPLDVARELHFDRMPGERLSELARVVYAEAPDDHVAAGIVDRLVAEVTALATVVLRRLDLTGEQADVVLGGSLMLRADPAVVEAVEQGVHEVAPRAKVLVAPSQPIVGAALLALDAAGADGAAKARLRAGLDESVARLERRNDG
jgi:N-acetylglucosamine kinase-like BadF-type ATPase